MPLDSYELLRVVYFFSNNCGSGKSVLLKGNYYWRYTNFSLNHDYGRKGINGVLDSIPLKSAHFLAVWGPDRLGLDLMMVCWLVFFFLFEESSLVDGFQKSQMHLEFLPPQPYKKTGR